MCRAEGIAMACKWVFCMLVVMGSDWISIQTVKFSSSLCTVFLPVKQYHDSDASSICYWTQGLWLLPDFQETKRWDVLNANLVSSGPPVAPFFLLCYSQWRAFLSSTYSWLGSEEDDIRQFILALSNHLHSACSLFSPLYVLSSLCSSTCSFTCSTWIASVLPSLISLCMGIKDTTIIISHPVICHFKPDFANWALSLFPN